ncbi:hypothetical protein GCM10016455_03320 [Aliiroseovarius zhejiangensis]|uniref:DUF177 domain-containing protein n=1 Tax=Aliiroseovarius zhejiangensis TaxID=1632025 RepID=A0ABQ3IPC1_9RHOB|nr:DUF177 domain-containing protein [Aliiroseovarius zhejiangensis]GHE86954.1 hypothetical protein GCM10016455_03320 [Aliiroseovarius zhejiangensis]
MTDTHPSGSALPFSHPLRVAELPTGRPTQFELAPDAAECAAIAADLGIQGLRKLRFAGELAPFGKHDWQMQAELGATVTQACVVTLDPVTTRIDDRVDRRWLRDLDQPAGADEVEMPEDDTIEALGTVIDLGQVMVEALALALPLYPRAEGAEIQTTVFTEPGLKPMSDEDAKPFAGLSGLRDKLGRKDN